MAITPQNVRPGLGKHPQASIAPLCLSRQASLDSVALLPASVVVSARAYAINAAFDAAQREVCQRSVAFPQGVMTLPTRGVATPAALAATSQRTLTPQRQPTPRRQLTPPRQRLRPPPPPIVIPPADWQFQGRVAAAAAGPAAQIMATPQRQLTQPQQSPSTRPAIIAMSPVTDGQFQGRGPKAAAGRAAQMVSQPMIPSTPSTALQLPGQAWTPVIGKQVDYAFIKAVDPETRAVHLDVSPTRLSLQDQQSMLRRTRSEKRQLISSWSRLPNCSVERPRDPPNNDSFRAPPSQQQDLPAGWERQWDLRCLRYVYFNRTTQEQSWHKPCAAPQRHIPRARDIGAPALSATASMASLGTRLAQLRRFQDDGCVRHVAVTARERSPHAKYRASSAPVTGIASAGGGGAGIVVKPTPVAEAVVSGPECSREGVTDVLQAPQRGGIADIMKRWGHLAAVPQQSTEVKAFLAELKRPQWWHHVATLFKNAAQSVKEDRACTLSVVRQFGYALQYASDNLKADKEVVLAAVNKDGWALQYANDTLKADEEVVLAAVKQSGQVLQYASDNLKADKGVVLAAVNRDGHRVIQHMATDLQEDKDVWIAAVHHDVSALQHACENLKADKEFILAVVKEDGMSLQYAHESLQRDRDIVLTAVKQNGTAFDYVSDTGEMWHDKDFILAMVSLKGDAFDYVSKTGDMWHDKDFVLAMVSLKFDALDYVSKTGDMWHDKDFVLAVVSLNGNAFECVSKTADMWHDKDFVLPMVALNCSALRYASDDLQDDKDVILSGLRNGMTIKDSWLAVVHKRGHSVIQYAATELQEDKDVWIAAVNHDGYALRHASVNLKADKEVVLAAVKGDGTSLQYAHENLQRDGDVVLAAVKQNGNAIDYVSKTGDMWHDKNFVLSMVALNDVALRYASNDLKNDKDVIFNFCRQRDVLGLHNAMAVKDLWLAVVHKCGHFVIQYAATDLQEDKDVWMAAVSHDGSALQHASCNLKADQEVVLAAVNTSGHRVIQYAATDLQKDKDVWIAAVNHDGSALQHASNNLKADKELVLEIVKEDGMSLQYAHESLQRDRDVVLAAVKQNSQAFKQLKRRLTWQL